MAVNRPVDQYESKIPHVFKANTNSEVSPPEPCCMVRPTQKLLLHMKKVCLHSYGFKLAARLIPGLLFSISDPVGHKDVITRPQLVPSTPESLRERLRRTLVSAKMGD